MGSDKRYDITFKKTDELSAGADAAVAGDKFIMLDVSDGENPVVRTVQDILSLVDTPYSVQVSVSLAELNAGKTIVAAVVGKQIVVTDFNFVMDGKFEALTSAELEDSSATINVCSLAVAQMADNAILTKDTTGVTLGVGCGEGITSAEALVITKTGSDATTATGLTVTVTYLLV